MTRFCGQYPYLVGARHWLPPEPFEFGWTAGVGCNNLHCERCGEQVRSETSAGEPRRRYACGCQQQDVYDSYQVGGESEDLYPALTGWACAGHPGLLFPATLDGMRLDTATDWDALVTDTILHPPFRPPRIDLAALWITRLYRLLAAERALLSQSVANLLSNEDPRLVRGAYDFFYNEREAVGVEQIAASVAARRDWLSNTPNPDWPSSSLLDHAALLLHRRLQVVDEIGNLADQPALEVARELALAGIGPSHTPLAFSNHDPEWLLTHAVQLVRANPGWISMLVHTMKHVPPQRRKHILHDITHIAPDNVLGAIEQHFQEPERGDLLSFLKN